MKHFALGVKEIYLFSVKAATINIFMSKMDQMTMCNAERALIVTNAQRIIN